VLAPAVLLATAAAALAPAMPAQGQLLLGVQDDALLTSAHRDAWPLAKGLNVRVVRFNVAWDAVANRTRPRNPANPDDPAYDWSRVDLMARNTADIGAQALFTIGGSPRWANGGRPSAVAPRRPFDFGRFCRAVGTRYSGRYVPEGATEPLPRVRLFSVWNEPNRGQYFRPQAPQGRGAAGNEAALMRACLPALHAAAPGSRVALGPLASRGAQGGVSPLGFLSAYRRAGGPRPDVVALNPYLDGLMPVYRPDEMQPSGAITLRNLDQLQRAAHTAWGGRMPVWLTEFGWRVGFNRGLGQVTPSRQAELARASVGLVRDRYPYVEMFVWFLLRDQSPGSYWRSGLVLYDWTRKPAYRVWALGAPPVVATPLPVPAPVTLWTAAERRAAASRATSPDRA
jgi:hypothetical protein